ncbi:MAG: hypothetical protein CME71_04220 [Halobacteriovorax sp.]|nr:hypothetical protein [Halobacteriovorax sp.]
MKILTLIALIYSATINAAPDWGSGARLPESGHRTNIYEVAASELTPLKERGYLHAFRYPVSVTGLYIPYRPLARFMQANERNPLRRFLVNLAGERVPFSNIDEMYDWLGLTDFPKEDAQGIFKLPYPNGKRPDYPMGASFIETKDGLGLTFSCAACHSMDFFGQPVMGLTNKQPRANEMFRLAQKYIPKIPSSVFLLGTGASFGEAAMFSRTKKNLGAVGAIAPQTLGLDTSLAQVALSLVRRNDDDYATKNRDYEKHPRHNELSHFVADSKPAVWWNVKYKTRWLSDGSIVSGNPIFTNFLWNEIGRGTDLEELEDWMKNNQPAIKELTASVFATEAPTWGDIFPLGRIDLSAAKRGANVFEQTCQKCHGEYQKNWQLPNAETQPLAWQIKTAHVKYHDQTPIKNVGTDPQRFEGMKHFAEGLNKLAISKMMKTVVEPQEGYVPPPLVGVFMRYPYFHNNAIPNLCALLTPPDQRPKKFWQGPAKNMETDFDFDCVGYPVGDAVPEHFKTDDAIVDTTKPGQRATGHYKMLLNEDGSEKWSAVEKRDLIEFLKTL